VVNGFGTVDKIEVFWDYVNNPTVKTTFNSPSLNDTYTNQYPVFGNQPAKTYTVLIRAYSGSGCSTDYSASINLLAAPKVQFTQPVPVCQEAPAFSLAGSASDIFGLPGNGIYSGQGVVSDPTFSPLAAGFGTHTIRYTYTTNNGCNDFAEKDIVVNPTPVINFGASTINVLEGDILQLAPKITNGNTYLWSPSTYLSSAVSATPTSLPTNDITYSLQVTSVKGCEATQSVAVKVVRKYVVPNTFTPNNDGNHDRFEIENLSLYPDVRVRIFSRTGQLVFESYGYNTPWDGKYKGQDCPFGTYYYVIETGGGRKPRTGYVTIIR
jgi:gliding motility-associated-like protein